MLIFLVGRINAILPVVDLGEPFSIIIKLYNESGGSRPQGTEQQLPQITQQPILHTQ